MVAAVALACRRGCGAGELNATVRHTSQALLPIKCPDGRSVIRRFQVGDDLLDDCLVACADSAASFGSGRSVNNRDGDKR